MLIFLIKLTNFHTRKHVFISLFWVLKIQLFRLFKVDYFSRNFSFFVHSVLSVKVIFPFGT